MQDIGTEAVDKRGDGAVVDGIRIDSIDARGEAGDVFEGNRHARCVAGKVLIFIR